MMTRLNRLILAMLLLTVIWSFNSSTILRAVGIEQPESGSTGLTLEDLKEAWVQAILERPPSKEEVQKYITGEVEAMLRKFLEPINESLNSSIDYWFALQQRTPVRSNSDREDKIRKLADPEKDRLVEYIRNDPNVRALLRPTLSTLAMKTLASTLPPSDPWRKLLQSPAREGFWVANYARALAEIRILGELRHSVSVEEKIQALREGLAQVQQEIQDLQVKLKLPEEIQTLHDALAQLQIVIAAAQREQTRLENQLSTLKQEMEDQARQTREQPMPSDKEIQMLQDALAKIQVDLTRTQQEKDHLEGQVSTLQRKLENLQAKIERLESWLPWVLVGIWALITFVLAWFLWSRRSQIRVSQGGS